jgi:ATP-dependent exoDNAse (exonuclease V) alpha subunit
MFITGKAGTGKSTLLREFIENTRKKVVVLAPTGIAAINVQGMTIHSFFKFKAKFLTINDIEINSHNERLYNSLDAIVIDECSMVRSDLMDAIDRALRLSISMSEPFGGVQLIFVGDMYQLPPVVSTKEEEIYNSVYESPYFFDAHCMKNINLSVLELNKVFRQNDTEFLDVLDNIRRNKTSQSDLDFINARCIESHNGDSIILTATNKVAGLINELRLKAIIGESFNSNATIYGKFESKYFPTEEPLVLKENVNVVMLKNDVLQHRYVNGDLGKIVRLEDDVITVKIRGDYHSVTKQRWENIEYYVDEFDEIEHRVVGSFTQFPVKLAWAITIHKSQGLTLDKCCVDLGKGAFSHGQSYVAISRVRNIADITFKKPLRKRDIIVDKRVNEFFEER